MEKRLAELVRLEDDGERRRFLARHADLLQREAVAGLCDRVVAEIRVDLDEAERLASAARFLAEELDDDYSRGRGLRAVAIVLTLRHQNDPALRRLEAALECFERAGDEHEAAITRSSGVQSLIHSGEYERALEWAAVAGESFRRFGDRLRLARLELNVGSILARQDCFHQALEHFRSAHEGFLEVGSPQDIGLSLCVLAVCQQDLNDLEAALETYRQAQEHCRRNDLPLLVLEADFNVAYLHYLRGEYAQALQLFEVARRSSEELEDLQHMALCDLDQSEIYLELNLAAEAAWLARRGREGFDRLGMHYELAKCLAYLAIARSRQGEVGEVLELLEEAREYFVCEENHVWQAMIDFHRSRVLFGDGRFGDASRLASEALEVFSRSRLPGRAAVCEIQLARLALAEGTPERAREWCAFALERIRPLKLPALEFQARAVSGQAEEALGDRSAAIAAYRQADAMIERLRSRLQTDELKISFLEDKLAVFESLVWLGLQGEASAGDRRAAFADIEKAKSRSLADLLAFRANAMPAKSAGDSELLERLRSLRRELNGLYRVIDGKETATDEGSRKQIEGLRGKCQRREEELLRVLRQVQAVDPEFSQLQEGTVLDLDAIRSVLAEDEVLIEYYFARGTVFACVAGPGKLEILPVSSVSRIRELHKSLQFQLSKLLLGKAYVERFAAVLQRDVTGHLGALYDELVAPVASLLTGKHLVIVPHDVLHYVPFHALFDGERYLIDRFQVSYAPSASVYYHCQAKPISSRGGALVLGVADERAPLIRREAEAVAEVLPGASLFLGEEASEENLRRHGRDSRIVHLATHGYFRRDNPMFSSIRLGTSRLSLFDLYDLELDAELVVLSGCGTGLAEVKGADELVGLSRGLLYAGARSVAVTLWDVNDESTAELMRSFYRHLTSGRAPARALRRAMLELREARPHPYYWAPFVLIGGSGGA